MQKYEYRPISSGVRGICWSPDSRRIAVVGGESGRAAEGCCIAYDTGSAVGGSFSGHSKPITSVAFRPVPPFRIMTGSEDTSVVFHEGPPFKFMRSCQTAHTNFVNSVCFSANGSLAFSCGSDGTVAVFTGDTGDLVSVLDPKLSCSIYGIALGPNNSLFAVCGDKKVRSLTTDPLSVNSEVAIDEIPLGITSDPIRSTVSVICLEGKVRHFSIGENAELIPGSVLIGSCGGITSITPQKESVLVTSAEGSIWALAKPFMTSEPSIVSAKKPFKASAGLVVDLLEVIGVSATSNELINIKTGDVKKYPIPPLTTKLVPCKPVGFALGDRDTKITRVHQPSRTFEMDEKSGETFGAFAVSHDGETMVTVPHIESKTSQLQQANREFVVNMRTRIRTGISTADIVNAAVNTDGSLIAVASGAQEIHVYKRCSGDNYEVIPDTAKVWTYHRARITSMVWAGKNILLTGGLDKTIHVWDTDKAMSGPVLVLRDQHKEGVSALYATRDPDGSLVIISGGLEGSISMWSLSRTALSPPKIPRNVFFPWQNFVLHQSGSYLEPNRVAFRVPVNMTKFDIREYLRKLYGVKVIKVNTYIKLPNKKMSSYRNFFKTDAQYKKAIVTCEETIPDEVKMMHSCRDLRLNPAVTKGMLDPKINKGNPARPGQSRSNDWKPRHRFAWREPLPLLLRTQPGGVVPDHPHLFNKQDEKELATDKTLPHVHFSNERSIPNGVPLQTFPRVNADLIVNSRKGLISNTGGVIGGKVSILAKRLSATRIT